MGLVPGAVWSLASSLATQSCGAFICVLVTFLITVRKCLMKQGVYSGSQFGSPVCHGSEIMKLLLERHLQLKSTEMRAGAQLAFSFGFHLGPQLTEWGHPSSRWVLSPLSANLETPSQTCPDVRLLNDSTSCQVENINHHNLFGDCGGTYLPAC